MSAAASSAVVPRHLPPSPEEEEEDSFLLVATTSARDRKRKRATDAVTAIPSITVVPSPKPPPPPPMDIVSNNAGGDRSGVLGPIQQPTTTTTAAVAHQTKKKHPSPPPPTDLPPPPPSQTTARPQHPKEGVVAASGDRQQAVRLPPPPRRLHSFPSQSHRSIGGGAFRRSRPLPSSHVLLSTLPPPTRSRSLPPILKHFFQTELGKDPPILLPPIPVATNNDGRSGAVEPTTPVGVGLPGDGAAAAATTTAADESASDELGPDAAFESRGSTLTDAQHTRFLELAPLVESRPLHLWKESTRREYQNLLRKVLREQDHYRRALERFWVVCGMDRLPARSEPPPPAGQRREPPLPAGENGNETMTEYKRESVYDPVEAWKRLVDSGGLPQCYGKCNQVISLGIVQDPFAGLGLDALKAQVLWEDPDAADVPRVDQLPTVGTVLPLLPSSLWGSPPALVALDAFDRGLAEKYKVDLLTTEDTLRTALAACHFLHRSSDLSPPNPEPPSLAIPVSRPEAGAVVALDVPVPQSGGANSRERREAAAEEALYQSFLKEQTSPQRVPQRYTLLTIPVKGRSPLRVLVRSPVRLRMVEGYHEGFEDSAANFKVHTQAEYFPERGQELPNALDKAVWVLDHLLGGGSDNRATATRVAVCRFDVTTGTCLGWDDASWAAATSEPARWYERIGGGVGTVDDEEGGGTPTGLWRRLASLLHAARTVGVGQHVLTYPGRGGGSSLPRSATVHGADPHGGIDLLQEVREAAAARTAAASPEVLLRDFRPWKWTHPHHVPYTFPTASPQAAADEATGAL